MRAGPSGNRTCNSTCAPGLLDCDSQPGCDVGPFTPGFQFAPDRDNDQNGVVDDGFITPGDLVCYRESSTGVQPNGWDEVSVNKLGPNGEPA